MMTPREESEGRAALSAAHFDYQKGLNTHAFFKVSDHAMGEDLVQETFMKTWKYLVRGGEIAVMKAFLYHVLNNLIVDQYRKKKTASLDVLLEKGYEPGEDGQEQVINEIDGKALILLIAYLPETYKKVMRMRFIQELSLSEMSLITGKSKNTMAVQVHRGIEKLKILYGPGLTLPGSR